MNISSNPRPLCTAVLGSLTKALKAQRTLAKHAVLANVIKISRKSAEKGCSYGIEFACELTGNVKEILASAGIDVKEYFR